MKLIRIGIRKLIKQVQGGPMIRLNQSWVDDLGLKLGDSVDVCRLASDDKCLVITRHKKRD